MKSISIFILLILISCQDHKPVKKRDVGTPNEIHPQKLQAWCMFKRTGFRGDTSVVSKNRIIIKSDSLITYIVDGKIIYSDQVYNPVHFGSGKPGEGFSFPQISIYDSTKILVYYAGGEDGDQEYYQPCE